MNQNSILTLTSQSDKLFFGNSGHGLARYDIPRYSVLKKLNEKMKSLFWSFDEIDMSAEKASFSKMSDAEKFVFTENIKRQILLDSIQGRSPALVFQPSITDPTLENCFVTLAFFEQIHSTSYTHILQAIFPNPTIIYDEIPGIQPIADCSNSITEVYDRMITMPTKENLYLALIAMNALEGLRFFASFACSFSFAERGLVEGSAKQIKFIARDETCLHPNTEVLTTSGWRKIFEVGMNENVAQLNIDSSEISFAKPVGIIRKHYYGDMCRFIYKHSGKVLQNVTGDHDVIISPYNNKQHHFNPIKKYKASEVKLHGFNYFPVSGTTVAESCLTDEERLLIAIQADGSLSNRYTGEICGTIPIWMELTKQRKIDRLVQLLNRLGYSYSISKLDNAMESKFIINVPITLKVDKELNWVNISSLTTLWCREFMEELVDYLYYSNTNESAIDKIQAILSFTGYKHRRGLQIDYRKESYKDIHRIYWWNDPVNIGRISTQNLIKETYKYKGEVGCLTMPEGTLVTRYNGNVCITGNCHLALVQHVLKLLPKDDPDFIQVIGDLRPQAIEIFEETAQQEKDWCKYIFQHGSILGLNEKILSDYIEYLLPRRKSSAGISTTTSFTSENPIPWVNKWYTDSNYQPSPQEIEGTAYLTSTLKNDISDLKFEL
jgi:ribonucleotide reductase beta subunit family protein with ferritin-like domain